jgi:pimeloyl-ACP methyl ester carboxylesterase
LRAVAVSLPDLPDNGLVTAHLPHIPAKTPAARLPTWLHVSDIQGLAQLATQGVLGVADLAETVHGNVYKAVAVPFGPLGQAFVDRSPGASGVRPRGITGLVYGGVRGAARLTGSAVNAALAGAAPLLPRQSSSPTREAMLAALNGVLGDQLLQRANPLTITMRLRHRGQALTLEKPALANTLAHDLPQITGKILVLVHGLCMNDLQWTAKGLDGHPHNHGEFLAQALGYTPLYLHYNTGLHTSVNGQELAALLEQLVGAWPVPIADLSLLGHSMGGLVARSACEQARTAGLSWRAQLKNLVFLGTPHHGAPLERVGSWIDSVLGSNAITRPFARIGQIRSSGITDLRHGHVLAAHWEGQDRFEPADGHSLANRQPLPLPEGVACFAVAATTSKTSKTSEMSKARPARGGLRGDGLVPVASALGTHANRALALTFPPENQYIAYATDHLALLKSPAIAAQLVIWLGGAQNTGR